MRKDLKEQSDQIDKDIENSKKKTLEYAFYLSSSEIINIFLFLFIIIIIIMINKYF